MERPLRVLIVEDSEQDAQLLIRELRRGAYEPRVERVDTAAAMRDALEREAWDVVLSDYAMPSFSAPAALSLLKESGQDIPFIIVSGTIGEETAVEAMRAGAQDFMVKDNLTRLLPAIEREVREADRRRERIAERIRTEAEREQLLTELRDAVRARDTFLAIASHELRTPLTSLQIQVHILQTADRRALETTSARELEGAIRMIGRQATRLQALVANLLDVVQITSGRMKLDREPVNLCTIVYDVVDYVRQMNRDEPKVVIEAQSIVGMWDQFLLQSVVSNLISNAVKFGEAKPIKVSISENGQAARIVVADQGIGMSPEQQMLIFEKFERAVSERHYGGFGLGLWIVRQIVEAHGGSIRVASETGKGSTFIVELPLSSQTVA